MTLSRILADHYNFRSDNETKNTPNTLNGAFRVKIPQQYLACKHSRRPRFIYGRGDFSRLVLREDKQPANTFGDLKIVVGNHCGWSMLFKHISKKLPMIEDFGSKGCLVIGISMSGPVCAPAMTEIDLMFLGTFSDSPNTFGLSVSSVGYIGLLASFSSGLLEWRGRLKIILNMIATTAMIQK